MVLINPEYLTKLLKGAAGREEREELLCFSSRLLSVAQDLIHTHTDGDLNTPYVHLHKIRR